MPLLSLPRELLLDIIGYIAHHDSGDGLDYRFSYRQASRPYGFAQLRSLAQTCSVLRSVSITYLYATVTLCQVPGPLGDMMKCYPHIAALIRTLKIEAPGLWDQDTRKTTHLILRHCTGLLELVLEKLTASRGQRSGFEDVLLGYLPRSTQNTLKSIEFGGLPLDGLLAHFLRLIGGNFTSLKSIKMKTFDISNSHDVVRHKKELSSLMNKLIDQADGNLRLLQTFLFHADFPYVLPEETDLGACFAHAMPNLKSLSMRTSTDILFGTLTTYVDLGSQLTELTIAVMPATTGPRFCGSCNHFCRTIRLLSQNLAKLTISGSPGMRICHSLFAPDTHNAVGHWSKLEFLHGSCLHGCKGIRPDKLRLDLMGLTKFHPDAVLFLEGRHNENLVSWNTASVEGALLGARGGVGLGDGVIGNLKAFERLREAVLSPRAVGTANLSPNTSPENWRLVDPDHEMADYSWSKAPWSDEEDERVEG